MSEDIELKALDLDALEKVAFDHDAPHEHAKPWEVHHGSLVKRRNPSNEHVATSRDYADYIATFDPPTVLRLIAALRALSPPLELEGEREAIARIIDPNLDYPWNPFGRSAALAKADAILSRRSTLPVGGQGVKASVAESAGEEPDGSFASEGLCKSTKMLIDQDWLRRKVEVDPDTDVEATSPYQADEWRRLEWRRPAYAPYDRPLWGFRLDEGRPWPYGILDLMVRTEEEGHDGWFLWSEGEEINPPRLWVPAFVPPKPDEMESAPPTPLGALRFRMEQGGHTQADFAKLIGSRARASEILAGKRELSKAHIRLLVDEWGVPARSLLGPSEIGAGVCQGSEADTAQGNPATDAPLPLPTNKPEER